jgi:hypothetical protein
VNRKIVLFIVAIICVGGLIAEYKYMNRNNSKDGDYNELPPTEQVGLFTASSGGFIMYMHNAPIQNEIKSGYELREGNRLLTQQRSWAEFDGCIDAPEYVVPAKFHLRESSCIGLMKPPAIDIERGSFAVRVPAGSMGLRVNLKVPEYSMSAQCLANDADMLVIREGNCLIVIVYKGMAKLWNTKGEITVAANQKGNIVPDKMPIGAEQITDSDKPADVVELFNR